MVVLPVPVDQRPKSIRPHNTTGVVPNTPLGKRSRRSPSFIVAGSKPSTSPFKVPSPLWKRMALLDNENTHDFIGDRVCVSLLVMFNGMVILSVHVCMMRRQNYGLSGML